MPSSLSDGEVLNLGGKEFTAHLTPGHTPGAMSWTWNACSLPWQPPVCRRVAYVDSLSPVSADDYRFTDHPAVVADFRRSIAKVATLPCDLLATPHRVLPHRVPHATCALILRHHELIHELIHAIGR